MTCKCSPSLVRLMRAFSDRGHVNSGCCASADHRLRSPRSDHNEDTTGYAHAQDIHELADHDLQPFVDYMMRNPGQFPQVKYLIFEGFIYYPHAGARPAGKYVYTGPNSHAHHLHVSIHADATFYAGSWHVDDAYRGATPPEPTKEEDDMRPVILTKAGGGGAGWLVLATGSGLVKIEMGDGNDTRDYPSGYGPIIEVAEGDLAAIPEPSGATGRV